MNEDAPTQLVPAGNPPPRGELTPGQRVFGRYTLEAQVGRGGMGVVWRAHDDKLERTVALKFLPPEVAADPEAVRDLKAETRRCLDLTHANIVRVYDFVEEAVSAAIAMEFVEGESLAKQKVAAPGGCLSAAYLAPLVTQLCAALRNAHQVAKVVHHDLKPANLLVTRDGVLKVTDFGIARSLTENHTRQTGNAGGTSGTLMYMSPQQLTGEPPTAADDIYALGATLYELLTGKPPFYRGDVFSLRQQVTERVPAALELHRAEVGCTGPEIPPRWAETILACLAKRPEDRPASAADVAGRFGLAKGSAASLPPFRASAGTPPANSAAMSRPPFRRSHVPWLIATGSVVLLLAAVGLYFGVYAPEHARLAAEQERARKAELALHAERVRQAEEKQQLAEQQRGLAEQQRRAAEEQAAEDRRREEAARAQTAKDQQAYAAIMARITALTDRSPVSQRDDLQRAVRNYLRTAPNRHRDAMESAWNDRQTAWQAALAASRPGSLVVQTAPPGATVVLYPRNERKTSPAVFDDVKPGEVSLRIEKEGYEPRELPFVVKPGTANQVPRVELVANFGELTITSEPSDLFVVLEGNGRRLDGRTPFNPTLLSPGEYRVTFHRAGWRPQTKVVTVERNKHGQVFADLWGFRLEVLSEPPGAQITVDQLKLRAAPLTLVELEPREYLVTATLDGYETARKTVAVQRNDRVVIALTEKPLHRALRRLVGSRWVYESLGVTAELAFDLQGRITGTHRVGLSGQVADAGNAESFNANSNTLTVRFAASQGRPFFPADAVRIRIMDDTHLAVTWTAGGRAERYIFVRSEAGKK